MLKQIKTVEQDKITIVNLQTKSRTFNSSSRAIDNILSHTLEFFCRYWNAHQVEEVNCTLTKPMDTPDQLKPDVWWHWLLKSPSYLTTNQSRRMYTSCQAAHTLTPNSAIKNPSLTEFGGEWIHVCVWRSHSAVRLKLSPHCSLTILQYKISIF